MHLLNTISKLVLLTCTDAGEYLSDTLYGQVELTSYSKNLRETVDLAVRRLQIKPTRCWPTTVLPSSISTSPHPHTAPAFSQYDEIPNSHHHSQCD